MPIHRRRRRAFTLVEMLIVVGVTAILMSLVLVGLFAARKQANLTLERNHARQLGLAWLMYANQHEGHVIPGYLSTRAQRQTRARFRFPDGDLMTPAPQYNGSEQAGPHTVLANPWVWRLLPYLDYDYETLTFNRDGDGPLPEAAIARAVELRDRPAFGYNLLHVGGWWFDKSTTWFGGRFKKLGTHESVQMESRHLGSIRHADRLITFATSALRPAGVFRYSRRKGRENFGQHGLGSFSVLPPKLLLGNGQSQDIWGPARLVDDHNAMELFGLVDERYLPDG